MFFDRPQTTLNVYVKWLKKDIGFWVVTWAQKEVYEAVLQYTVSRVLTRKKIAFLLFVMNELCIRPVPLIPGFQSTECS